MKTDRSTLRPLLLIEDDPDLGPMMVEVLGDDYAVTLVADGADGFTAACDGDFDVIVVDRGLPSLNGVELVSRMRQRGVATPALILTALGTVDDRVQGLDAGADDYLVKPFDVAELLARLRALLREHATQEAAILIGDWEFRPASRFIESPYDGRIVMTETEANLLQLLARNPDQTLSRQRILREVFSLSDSAGTVDTYVHYIRKKTERDIIVTVRGRGYRIGRL